ncbi:MAG: SIMPL domain-containing protein [Cyanobacteria bacterium P01_D01_bin.73]
MTSSIATSGLMLGAAIAPLAAQFIAMPEVIALTTIQERTISVSGNGSVAIPSTHAVVRLGVEVQGRDAASVQAQLAAQSNTLVDWLKKQALEDLQTQSISLSPRYGRNSELIGYTASTTLTFRTAIADSGKVIDGAVKNGATRINNISLTATPAAIQEARKQALILASQNAQAEADIVLGALGLSRREIIGIQLQGAPSFQFATRGGIAMEAPGAPIVGGEQTISAFVTMQIRY